MHKSRRTAGKILSSSVTDLSNRLVFYISFTLVFLLTSLNCSFDKPNAPSWDTNVSIPLISKSYTMAELAEKESSISLDSTDNLYFEIDADLDNYYIGDELYLESLQDNFSLTLGSFSIDSPSSVSTSVILSEIFSQADALHGLTVIVPAFSFQTDKKSLDPYDSFSYVVIETGNISLQVQNNLAIPLGSPLTLEIWHTAQDTLISSTTSSSQIPAGSSANFVINLAGKKIPNQLSVRMIGDSPGSSGAPVLVDKNSSFGMTAGITNLSVEEALAEVPAQVISGEEQLSITDSVVVIDAKIESGSVDFTVSGNFALDAWVRYELPDFVSPTGSALVDSVFISASTPSSVSINLNNYSFQPEVAGFGQQTVRFSWTARMIDSGSNMVLVKSSDIINVNFNVDEIHFYQLTGKFGQKEFDIEQDEIEFDIPVDLDSLFFETARLELLINNGINFPANIDLVIEGQNESGTKAQIYINQAIQAASAPGVPTPSVIVLDSQNSNIKDFISIVPNLLRVSGKVVLGDENIVGTVSKNDFVNGSVKITAPFALRLSSQSIETETIELKIDEEVKDKIIDNLSAGALFMEITNHLPVGASLEIIFSQDEMNLYQNPVLQITAIRADAAFVDASGLVQSSRTAESTIGMSEEQMRIFLLSPLYAGIRISLDGTNGQFVTLRGSDYIQVKSYSRINVTVNRD
ncbi:hypothetical protein IH785_04725 [candidate division KSB1 bacterium]|nr:hypothetical protein [candidate division KSB1 bacterium]